MTSNGFTLADPNDRGMLDVVGFDTTVLDARFDALGDTFATRTPVPVRTSQAWLRRFNSAFASRLFFGLQTLTVKSRLLPGENAVRIRGNPPIFPAQSLLQQWGGQSKEEEARLKNS